MRVGGQLHAPAALLPGKRPGTHCIRGWVGPRAGLVGRGKSRPHQDSIPDRLARSESKFHHTYGMFSIRFAVGNRRQKSFAFIVSDGLQIHRYVTPYVSWLLLSYYLFPVAEMTPMRKELHADDLRRDLERPRATFLHGGA